MWKKISQYEELTVQFVHLKILGKWLLLAGTTGMIVGLIASLFSHCLTLVTNFRITHPAIIGLLPFAGLIIIYLYHLGNQKNNRGTNLIISSIRSDEQIPKNMAFLIFVATTITHLFGGSAGREGAALQLGGCIGQNIARALKLNEQDMQTLTMCAMSAAFSALFGTPITASIFSMEVISVGIMHYAALVPCALASIIACSFANELGVKKEAFLIGAIPNLTIINFFKVMILAMLCAYLSILFCYLLHKTTHLFSVYLPNDYLRIFVGGSIVVILTMIIGTDYNGAGMDIIKAVIEQETVKPLAFLLKMLFTAVTLGCGFKGGEIVPSFFVGATFGGLVAPLLGLPISLSGALGLTVLFCAVTNCPITALLLSFELFGFVGLPYFLIAVAIGYMLSGYYGLYNEQKIMYSKFNSKFIDAHANRKVD